MVNGGSEANFLSLFALLDPGDRLAFMVPNYMQGAGLGRAFGKGTDTFRLKLRDGRWALDLEELDDAVGQADQGHHGLQPEQPDGLGPDRRRDGRRRAGRRSARRVDRRGRDLPRRRTRRRRHHVLVLGALRTGDRHERTVEGVRDAGPAGGVGGGTAGDDRAHLGTPRLHDPDAQHGLGPARGARDDPRRARGDPRRARDRSSARTTRRSRPGSQSHADVLEWVRPTAGAIAYAKVHLPGKTKKLVERIRRSRACCWCPARCSD